MNLFYPNKSKKAEHAQSQKDFLSKMNISLKGANETNY